MPTKTMPTTRSTVVGKQLPNRVQSGPFGSMQMPNAKKTLGQAPPALLQSGPAQASEQFNHPDINAATARGLNQLQQNIQQALAEIKSDPTANKNLLENVAVQKGGAAGANPNIISHGLSSPYRGYRICSVKNGSLNGHTLIAPTQQYSAQTTLLLWTDVTPFGSAPVSLDIEVYS